jgi:SAM-dependent methyltransferase
MKPTDDPNVITGVEHETWERCAAGYVDGFGALVSESIAPLLDAACVGACSRVLDVGTGPGLVAAAARDRQATAVGIDFSESMVAEARRRYPDVEFQHANAEALPFDASEFDAVVGNFVLHHLACPDKVLNEVHRVLRDGGKAAFTVWSDLSKLAGFGLFFGAMEEHADLELPHGPLFGVSDFTTFHKMLRNAGFHDSAVTELNLVWRISSIDSYLDACRAWSNLDALPDSKQAAVEAAVRDSAKKLATGGLLTVPNPAILATAVK